MHIIFQSQAKPSQGYPSIYSMQTGLASVSTQARVKTPFPKFNNPDSSLIRMNHSETIYFFLIREGKGRWRDIYTGSYLSRLSVLLVFLGLGIYK